MPQGIFNDHLSLITIPLGKKYLGNKKNTIQTAQKGGVCWYNSFNLLRPRLGKQLEKEIKQSLEKNPHNMVASKLLEFRTIEKAISQYRKNIEKRAMIATLFSDFFEHSDSPITLKKAYQSYLDYHQGKTSRLSYALQQVLKYINALKLYSPGETLPQIIKLLDDYFLQNKDTSLKSYARKVREEDIYYFSSLICKELDMKESIEAAITKQARFILWELALPEMRYKIAHYSSEKIMLLFKQLPQSTQSKVMESFIVHEFAKKYKLGTLQWDVDKDGFSGLMTAIKTHGTIGIGVKAIGLGYYETSPVIEGNLSNYVIHSWPSSAKKSTIAPESGHAVTLIGAQRIKNKNNEIQETILFIDPNNRSDPHKRRIVYRVPYTQLVENLHRSSPLYCVNQDSTQEVLGLYKEWNQNNQALHQIQNEINRLATYKSSGRNFFVALGLIKVSDNKISAYESLKILVEGKIQSKDSPNILQEKLHLWYKAHEQEIKTPRNKIHRFFAPEHQTKSIKRVNGIIASLGINEQTVPHSAKTL